MPRKGTAGNIPQEVGAPNRAPVIDAPGGAYGERQGLAEAQAAAPPGSAPTQAPVSTAPDPLQAALSAAEGGLGPPIGMGGDPNAPVTSGSRLGPGPGREAFGPSFQGSSISSNLEQLGMALGDDDLIREALKARNRGL